MPRHRLALVLALGSAACFSLSRSAPPVQRFVVGGATPRHDAAALDTPALALGLRRLDLAPYLSTLEIIVRRADHQVVTTGFHRWAEHPATGLNRAVAAYLATTPTIRSIDVAPWPLRARHDYLLQLHISRFEGLAPARDGIGEAQLLARWEIVRPADGSLAARGVTDFRADDWRVGDYAALVRRLDDGLLRLAEDLRLCLGRLVLEQAQLVQAPRGDTNAPAPFIECQSARVPP